MSHMAVAFLNILNDEQKETLSNLISAMAFTILKYDWYKGTEKSLDGDQDVIDSLAFKLTAYILTGTLSEQVVFVDHSGASN